ncbi:GTPase IMAP family member 4-like [Silurus meridionalis]|nr:GTPase IMAP family member 4-like [Silurus meridionalis]
MNAETVWRKRQQWKAQTDDAKLLSSLWPDVYPHGSSSDEKSDLRLVVLGGDCVDNNYVSNIILRSVHQEISTNPKKGSFRGGNVHGRRVSVFVAPSYWMNHLASYMIFSNGVKSISHELENCTFLTFPGPHAFLLVIRAGHTTGKEHYLLKAIKCMFGAEVLQYTTLVFVHAHEWQSPINDLQSCLKMCGGNYFFLENSDEKVEQLFIRVAVMTQRKRSRFFIQQSYESLMDMCFERWENAWVKNEIKLKRELEEVKSEQCLRQDELDTLRQTETELRKELKQSRHREGELQKDLQIARCSEKQLRAEMDAYKRSEAGQWKCTRSDSISDLPPHMTETQNKKPSNDL